MKTFVLGDVHGGYKAILQCFERSGFDKENDRLICIGDVADGWPEAAETLEEILTVKDLHYTIGNHDWWTLQFLKFGHTPNIWLSQGGYATIQSYVDNKDLMEKHRDFYDKAPYYLVLDGNLYVHGGFNAMFPIKEDIPDNLIWDRDMWFNALETEKMFNQEKAKRRIGYQLKHINDYDKIFIGHTTTSRISDKPVNALNIWNVDQGAGFEGKLTIMNVDSKEFWQSDIVSTLYPGVKGRG